MLLTDLSKAQLVAQLQNAPLPGFAAQRAMAHLARTEAMAQLPQIPNNRKEAAVLALLYPHAAQWHLVFIVRPDYDGAHSGQLAFPGGGVEPEDADYEATALRETWEEVGVPAANVEVVRALTELYIPVSNFLVYPFVGIAAARPTFRLDPIEVVDIIEVPLAHFLDSQNTGITSLMVGKNIRLTDVPYYAIGERVLWGATAMILAEMVAMIATPDAGNNDPYIQLF